MLVPLFPLIRMLLRRSLFVLDISVLLAVVVFLVFLPAERCAHFEASKTPESTACNIHPAHHPDFSFTENLGSNEHLKNHNHLVSVCHRLKWSHFHFWENMYLILFPAIISILLIFYTVCEICDFELFIGQVRSTFVIIISIFSIIYTVGVLIHEKTRIENYWPFLGHATLLGADDSSISVTVPATWQYSIALCILSALFKIGRILIQHFFGDKKLVFENSVKSKKSEESTPVLLNETRTEIE